MESSTRALTDQHRLLAKEEAQKESRRADQKQHATKLIQGFSRIDANAPNRAIWEMVQNACDLASDCRITIDYRNGGFAFSHNGEPFTSNTLLALIKQVSSKGNTVSEEQESSIGKFGTGFITTHTFARSFTIDSLLDIGGQYVRIDNFLIDRSPMTWEALAAKLMDQEDNMYHTIDNGETVLEPEWKTTLTYLPQTEIERQSIANSYTHIHKYIPIVLAFSERLKEVTVIDNNGTVETYTKGPKELMDGLWVTPISSSESIQYVYSITDEQGEVEIILPLLSPTKAYKFDDSIARLFLYYPLIGTEKWGCNYIIHSKHFKPTEPRDGVYLKSNNQQTQSDEETNRRIIDKATTLILDFVKERASSIENPIELAQVAFQGDGETLIQQYYQELKEQWISSFKNCLLVETKAGRVSPVEAIFFAQDLLLDKERLPVIYKLASQFWDKLPLCELVKPWTDLKDVWKDDTVFKGIRDLGKSVSDAGNISALKSEDDLRNFYQYIIDKRYDAMFNEMELLPNIDGVFRKRAALNSKIDLPADLIRIARVLANDIPQKHIKSSFRFNFEMETYGRKEYSKDLNEVISKELSEATRSKSIHKIRFEAIMDYCLITTTNESASVPIRMSRTIAAFYNYAPEEIIVPAANSLTIGNMPAQKKLLQVFLNDIADQDIEWVKENEKLLETIIELLKYAEYSTHLQTTRLFPNQNYELCLQSTLKVDERIPEQMKEMYNRICKPSVNLEATLVAEKFEKHLSNPEICTSKNIGAHIEERFSEDGQYTSINDHSFVDDIMQVIELITQDENGPWGNAFPLLNGRKANILLDRVTGGTREAIFKILKMPPEQVNLLTQLAEHQDLENLMLIAAELSTEVQQVVHKIIMLSNEKLLKLGELIEHKDFDTFFKLGLEALDEEYRSQADFSFKYEIGTHIEGLIKDRMGEFISVEKPNLDSTVQDVQKGQDIIIYFKEKPIYFIEVKSRWKKNSAVRLSKLQTIRAYEEKDQYALCTVDMSKYSGDECRYQVSNAEKIKDLTRFNTTIGDDVSHLVDNYRDALSEDTIRIDGDYKTYVPVHYIDNGRLVEDFETYLLEYLSKYENQS